MTTTTTTTTDEPKTNNKDHLLTTKKKRNRKRKRKSTEVQDQEEEEVVTSDELQRTLYMEGIPFDCTESQVREFFEITHQIPVVQLRLPTWHDTGRLKGYGHVVVPTVQDRNRALQTVSGKYLQSRYIALAPAKPTQNNNDTSSATTTSTTPPSQTIILRNLSYQAQEDDVRNAIPSEYQTTLAKKNGGEIRIVRHSHTGRSKGFGYVEFVDVAAAKRFMEQYDRGNPKSSSAWSIFNRNVQLDYDHGRIKGSFRTADRKLWHKEYSLQN